MHMQRLRVYSILKEVNNATYHSTVRTFFFTRWTSQQNTSLPSEVLASWHEARNSVLSLVRFPRMIILLLSSATVAFRIWCSPATQFSVKL